MIPSRFVDEENADSAHDEDVQDTIDARALADARMEGQRAGIAGHPAGWNPWTDAHSAEFKAWEDGRRAGEAVRLARRAA